MRHPKLTLHTDTEFAQAVKSLFVELEKRLRLDATLSASASSLISAAMFSKKLGIFALV